MPTRKRRATGKEENGRSVKKEDNVGLMMSARTRQRAKKERFLGMYSLKGNPEHLGK